MASMKNAWTPRPGEPEIIRVYVDMVADLFHYGHVNFLRQARKHGDYLLVGVHAAETVMSYKRRPIFSMDERVASVGPGLNTMRSTWSCTEMIFPARWKSCATRRRSRWEFTAR